MAEAGATTALCVNQEVGNVALDLRCEGFTDAMTEAGGTVEVLVEPDGVVVSDTGIGMAPDALARAFEPFYRAVPERPMGTGLGLSIVLRLCERFGWTIALDSTLDTGTVARVNFGSAGDAVR